MSDKCAHQGESEVDGGADSGSHLAAAPTSTPLCHRQVPPLLVSPIQGPVMMPEEFPFPAMSSHKDPAMMAHAELSSKTRSSPRSKQAALASLHVIGSISTCMESEALP